MKVYVSSSDGKDTNDGLTEATPVATIAKGKSIIRDGKPDWLLLKRGDVWNEVMGVWSKSGKSPTEPMLISYYGEAMERPTLKTGDKEALSSSSAATLHDIAFVGLHFYAHTRDPDSADFVPSKGVDRGVYWQAATDGLLVEDMHIDFYGDKNISINGTISNVKVRRNVITDAYVIPDDPTQEHSQGLYAQEVTNLLIEENVFDHNGWNEKVPGADKTVYNHNMYINVTCVNLVVKNNITVRAASHGLQARPGGVVSGNLFVGDPNALSFGLVLGESSPLPGGVTGEVTDNVILSSGDIGLGPLSRGNGMQIGNIQSAVISGNILAHDGSAEDDGRAIELADNGIGIHDLKLQNNVIYDWRGNLLIQSAASFLNVLVDNNHFQSPDDMTYLVVLSGAFKPEITFSNNTWFTGYDAAQWFKQGANLLSFNQWTTQSGEKGGASSLVQYLDPDRKIADYHASIGKDPNFNVYIAEARKQSRQRYLPEYTAKPAMDFIREGFNVVP
jgi:hypothetical protein